MRKVIVLVSLLAMIGCCKDSIDQQKVVSENFKKEFVVESSKPEDNHMLITRCTGTTSSRISDYVWTAEKEAIDFKYPLFREYVRDQSIKFWK